MIIQSASALIHTGAVVRAESARQYSPPPPAVSAGTVSISQAARDLLAAEGNPAPANTVGSVAFDTNQGEVSLDIDAYFTPGGKIGSDLMSVPLLAPSQRNIDALAAHISGRMPGFLSDNGIPAAPASITYDDMGQIQLPDDYPYAEDFKRALAGNPAMEGQLRTVAALSSHVVEMEKSLAFQKEYAAANSQAEINAILAKYDHLFSDNRRSETIALNFTANGVLGITHDGKPLSVA